MEREKGYYIKQSFSNDFVDYMEELYKKYGESIFEIQGIANKYMDICQFSRDFFGNSTNVADVSVDANANVREKNVTQYTFENNKAIMRLNSLYMMYKKIKEMDSVENAKIALEKVINGEIFVNDLHTFSSMPYCYAFDLRTLLTEGMNFFHGNMKIGAPKRSDSFIALLIQSTAYISNQIAGACLYKNQEIILNKDSINYSFKIKDFASQYSFDKNFNDGNHNWSYTDISKSNIKIWENGKFVNLKKIYKKEYSDQIYVIKTASGKKLQCSKDHRIKVLYRGKEIEVKAEDVKIFDTVINTVVNSNLSINKESQEYIDGQFIGILSGDGCLSVESGISVSINNKERYIGEFLVKYAKDKYNKESFLEEDKRGNCHSWRMHSQEIRKEILNTYFLSDDNTYKCHDKHIDTSKYSLDFLVGFLDGILITDGGWNSIHKISLVNEKLVNNIVDIVEKLGCVHGDIYITPQEGNKQDLYTLTISNTINPYLTFVNIKRNINKKYYNSITTQYKYIGREYSEIKSSATSMIYQKGYVSSGNGNKKLKPIENTDVIVSIETFENDDAYVYEVETETGWYSAGHILTHNCSYPDLFVVLDWFYRQELGEDYAIKLRAQKENANEGIDREIWYRTKNQFQNLIYSLNFPFRGGQSAFTNVSVMDKGFMQSLFKGYCLPDLSEPNVDSTIELSKVFFEYFTEINCKEGVFTFPVTTLAISLDDNGDYLDPDFVDWSAKINSTKSLANVFQDVPTSFSSCCRLRNDFSKMGDAGYQNSFGVGGLSIGSHRVAGPNLPRLAILEENNPNILEEDLNIVHKILLAHREIVKERIAGGFLPLYTSGWIDLKRQYSTVGFVGGYEYVVNKGLRIENDDGQECLQKVLKVIKNKITSWQDNEKFEFILNGKAYLSGKKIWISTSDVGIKESTIEELYNTEDKKNISFAFDVGSPFKSIVSFEKKSINNIYNCEQIPAESMATRLAEADYILGFNNDEVEGKRYQLYSNQYIPLINDASIYDRFKIQGKFDSLTSGGAILHINVDDEKPISADQFKKLMNCARLLHTVYFAINYAYSECESGHYLIGKQDTCPICEKKIVQSYTRVVGFITPVKSWNPIRRRYEYPRRNFYHNGSLDIEKQITEAKKK